MAIIQILYCIVFYIIIYYIIDYNGMDRLGKLKPI